MPSKGELLVVTGNRCIEFGHKNIYHGFVIGSLVQVTKVEDNRCFCELVKGNPSPYWKKALKKCKNIQFVLNVNLRKATKKEIKEALPYLL